MLNRATSGSNRIGSNGFDCNICLDNVQEPVVNLCGHLYCKPCIDKWFTTQNDSTSSSSTNKTKSPPQCPVCKAKISKQSLVPLYAGRGCRRGRGQTTSSTCSKDKPHHQEGIVVPPRQLDPPLCLADSSKLPRYRRVKAPEVARWDLPVRDPQQDRLERLENMMQQMMISHRQAYVRLEHCLHVLYDKIEYPNLRIIKPTNIFDKDLIFKNAR